MNGEGTLEDAVMDGIFGCFDTDRRGNSNEPDNPTVVKVDGRYLVANEHSLQDSDYWTETGALTKCNGILIFNYVQWLGHHLEIGEMVYEGEYHDCQATGSWLMVSLSDDDAEKARAKLRNLITDTGDRTTLALQGYDYCTDGANGLVDTLADEIDAGNGIRTKGEMEYVIQLLASYESDDAEYVEGWLRREFMESTACYEDIQIAISNLDAGLFLRHTDDPKNQNTKGVFIPHPKALAEMYEWGLREKMGGTVYNEKDVQIEVFMGTGNNVTMSVFMGATKRVWRSDMPYSVFTDNPNVLYKSIINALGGIPEEDEVRITIAGRDDDSSTPEAQKMKDLRAALETIKNEYCNLDDVNFEHDSASSFMVDRLLAALERHDRCWDAEGVVIPA